MKTLFYFGIRIFLSLSAITFCYNKTSAAIWYVKASAGELVNDGLSWNTAFTSLQSAINAASNDDEIWVAAGTYLPTQTHNGTTNRHKTFFINKGIRIFGGFAGTPGTEGNFGVRNIAAHLTILSGDVNASGNSSDNAFHVVWFGVAVNSTATIDGLTITGGLANGTTFPENAGGGIIVGEYTGAPGNFIPVTPVISHCTVTGNTAAGFGGAMYVPGSNPQVSDCTFSNNSSNNGGAAMLLGTSAGNANAFFLNCQFINNSSGNGGGGAIAMVGVEAQCRPAFNTCHFENNQSNTNGSAMQMIVNTGGIGSLNANLCTFVNNRVLSPANGSAAVCFAGLGTGQISSTIANSQFSGNQGGKGGAVFIGATDESDVSVNFGICNFIGNSGTNGGAIYSQTSLAGSTLVKTGICRFTGNSAVEKGGAIASFGSIGSSCIATYANCIFSGNFAAISGGAAYCSSSPTVLTSCSLSGNKAPTGGAVFDDASGVEITNSILWGNSSQLANDDALPQVNNCIVEGGFAGAGNLDTDPLFVSQPNFNNAPTLAGDLHLLVCSPAIDAGNNAGLPPATDSDADFQDRIVNATGLSSDKVDIGAFEFQQTFSPGGCGQINDADCDGVADENDLCPGGDDSVDNNNDGLPDCAYPPHLFQILPEWKCGNYKVFICHNHTTLCVSYFSLSAHMAHGDYLGPCGNADCNSPLSANDEHTAQVLSDNNTDHRSASATDRPDIQLFPNPAGSETWLDLSALEGSACRIQLTDMHGALLASWELPEVSHDAFRIDVSNYDAGVYFLRVTQEQSLYETLRLVVTHK